MSSEPRQAVSCRNASYLETTRDKLRNYYNIHSITCTRTHRHIPILLWTELGNIKRREAAAGWLKEELEEKEDKGVCEWSRQQTEGVSK